jgi:glycosyltransferase involved in cell wall biosynthesis
MRILQVVHGFPPQEWAGTELVTLHLSHALRERGHEVTVLARTYEEGSPEGAVRESTVEGISVARIVNNYGFSPTFRLRYDNPFVNRPTCQWLAQQQPDVVHIQHVQHLSVSLLRMVPALGYPTVLNLHDFFFPCERIQLIDAQQRLCPGPDRGERCVSCLQDRASAQEARRRFTDMERALRAPDVVVTPSCFLTDKVSGYFPFLAGRIRTIAHGVKTVPGVTRERPPRTPGTPLRLLYIGVLAPHKGAHVLIEALKGISREAVEVSLYGLEWPQWLTYVEQLRASAKELSVKFCGPYVHDQLGDILMQHDVVVMPMIWEETFSLVTREAFLAGLPVVAARRGALIEAVQDGVNGLHFEPENPMDLRRCLERLLTEPGLLEQLRSAAPHVKTMAEYASEIEALYEEVRQQRSQRLHVELSSVVVSLSFSPKHEATGGTAPKVSVCLPTYNGAAFLAEAITSVLAQSYPHFELLIMDDGSTDATVEIARTFNDPRIHVQRNATQLGIPENWNRCLALAQGEYVCLFHQDDLMLPDNLARKVAMLDADPTMSFVHSAVEFLVEASAPNLPNDWMENATEDCVVDGNTYFRKLLFSNRICAPAVVMRRSRFVTIGKFEPQLGFACDYAMWLKLCVLGQVGFLSQPLLLYRWHQGNETHAYRFEHGVAEVLTARREALRYYAARTGEHEKVEILLSAVQALADAERRGAELDRQSEKLLVHIRELEQMQAKLWADIQRAGKSWEEQHTYIKELEEMRDKLWADVQRVGKSWEEQHRYIKELEEMRDTLWADAQRVGESWEKQRTYIMELEQTRDQLIAERERRIPQRLGRFVRKVISRVR